MKNTKVIHFAKYGVMSKSLCKRYVPISKNDPRIADMPSFITCQKCRSIIRKALMPAVKNTIELFFSHIKVMRESLQNEQI